MDAERVRRALGGVLGVSMREEDLDEHLYNASIYLRQRLEEFERNAEPDARGWHAARGCG